MLPSPRPLQCASSITCVYSDPHPAWPWTKPWMRGHLWKTLLLSQSLSTCPGTWSYGRVQKRVKIRVRNTLSRGTPKLKNNKVQIACETLADIHNESCTWLTTEKGEKMRREKQQSGAFMDILYTYKYPCQWAAGGESQEWTWARELGLGKWVFLFSLHKNTWIGLNSFLQVKFALLITIHLFLLKP